MGDKLRHVDNSEDPADNGLPEKYTYVALELGRMAIWRNKVTCKHIESLRRTAKEDGRRSEAAACRWCLGEQLHVTLAYGPVIDEATGWTWVRELTSVMREWISLRKHPKERVEKLSWNHKFYCMKEDKVFRQRVFSQGSCLHSFDFGDADMVDVTDEPWPNIQKVWANGRLYATKPYEQEDLIKIQNTWSSGHPRRQEAELRARMILRSWGDSFERLGTLVPLVYEGKGYDYFRKDCEILDLTVILTDFLVQALGCTKKRLAGWEKGHCVKCQSNLHATCPRPLLLWRPIRRGDRVHALSSTGWKPATVLGGSDGKLEIAWEDSGFPNTTDVELGQHMYSVTTVGMDRVYSEDF